MTTGAAQVKKGEDSSEPQPHIATLRIKPSVWGGITSVRQSLGVSWEEFAKILADRAEYSGIIGGVALEGWTTGGWAEHDALIRDVNAAAALLEQRTLELQEAVDSLLFNQDEFASETTTGFKQNQDWDDNRDSLTRNGGILKETPIVKAVRVSEPTWDRLTKIRASLGLTWSETLDILSWHLLQLGLLPPVAIEAALDAGLGKEIRTNRLWQKIHGIGLLPGSRKEEIKEMATRVNSLESASYLLLTSLETHLENLGELETFPDGDLETDNQ